MSWREAAAPVRMHRVALVAPRDRLRAALVTLAASGSVEPDPRPAATEGEGPAREHLGRLHVAGAAPVAPLVSRDTVDLDELVATGRADLLGGEAELERVAAGAVTRGEVAAIAGWVPAGVVAGLREQLAADGAALPVLALPRGVDPPTLLRGGGQVRSSFSPLVTTFGTVPYADLDPTLVAGAAYVVMFGMMFGDAGHGLLLVAGALLLRRGRLARLEGLHRVWPFVLSAGVAATVFGLLYGEFFGPTGVVPVLWLRPLDHPVTLLGVALGVGVALLAGAYALGIVNRWREGGWAHALVDPAGIAGAGIFAGAGLVALGLVGGLTGLVVAGSVLVALGLLLCFLGFLASAGAGAAGVSQATVEVFDTTVRLGTNVVSFARLAAFGLTHAALGLVVWNLTRGLWDRGGVWLLAAAAAFLVGTVLAFALEALIAGIQALRLSYYELFSRVFITEGRPFRPWHLPVAEGDPDATAADAVPAPGVPTEVG